MRKQCYVLIAIVVLLLLTQVQVAVAQDDELVRLMKYQLEAKDPGMAALLGVIGPPSLGHYYAGARNRGKVFGTFYVLGIGAIVVGSQLKEPVYEEGKYSWELEKTGEGLSPEGAVLIFIGSATLLATKIIEPFDAYKSALKYNAELLKVYRLNLALTYQFRF